MTYPAVLIAGAPSTLGALVSPGGGLVVVKNGGPTAMVDMVTHRDTVPTIRTLCAKAAGCKIVGAWTEDGELSGAKYDALDKDGKITDASKLTEADAPFDRATYLAKIGHAQDVHRFAGHGARTKAEIGGKPLLDGAEKNRQEKSQ